MPFFSQRHNRGRETPEGRDYEIYGPHRSIKIFQLEAFGGINGLASHLNLSFQQKEMLEKNFNGTYLTRDVQLGEGKRLSQFYGHDFGDKVPKTIVLIFT